MDSLNYLKAPTIVREKETAQERWCVRGLWNLVFLAVVIRSVFVNNPPCLREGLMIAAALGSYFSGSSIAKVVFGLIMCKSRAVPCTGVCRQ